MRAQFSKKFYRQWKTVEGEAKWSAFSFVWGILVPRGIGAVITGIAGLIWPTELSRPWLYLYFFGMYVLCWLLIAAIMTIAAKGKQLLVDEELQERMWLRKLGELEHQIARGEIILNQYRVKDPTKKIDEQFPRWEAEVMTHLQNFFDSDRVTCLLDSNDIPINYQVTEGVREEEKQTYFVPYSRIMRLRQFHAEVEEGVS